MDVHNQFKEWGAGLPMGMMDDLLLNRNDAINIDEETLHAIFSCSGNELLPFVAGGADMQQPRLKETRSLNNLQQAGPAGPAARHADSSDSEDDEKRVKQEPEGSHKRARGESGTMTKSKACREKARREKINERFLDLAKLIEPGGEPKTDKATILCDAIKFVQQQTVENHQLKQLNKFLEERVGQFERERGQALYQLSTMQPQQHMMPQHTMLVAMPQGMPYGLGPSSGMMPMGPPQDHLSLDNQQQQQQQQQQLVPQQQQQQQQQPQQQPQQQLQQPHQQQQQQQAIMSMAQYMPYMPMVGKPAMGGGGGMQLAHNPYWMPSQMNDSVQDSLLRPPAA